MERLLYVVCSINILYVSSSMTFWKWQNYRESEKMSGYQEFGGKNGWIGGTWGIFQFSCSVVSDSLWPDRLQHLRPPCPSPTLGACSNSCPLSRWYHPTISTSIISSSSCLQSLSASGSFPMSQLFASGGQSIGASASVLPVNIQDWFSLGLMGLICPCHPECGQSRLTLEAKSHIYVLIYNIYFSLSDFPHCL